MTRALKFYKTILVVLEKNKNRKIPTSLYALIQIKKVVLKHINFILFCMLFEHFLCFSILVLFTTSFNCIKNVTI